MMMRNAVVIVVVVAVAVAVAFENRSDTGGGVRNSLHQNAVCLFAFRDRTYRAYAI